MKRIPRQDINEYYANQLLSYDEIRQHQESSFYAWSKKISAWLQNFFCKKRAQSDIGNQSNSSNERLNHPYGSSQPAVQSPTSPNDRVNQSTSDEYSFNLTKLKTLPSFSKNLGTNISHGFTTSSPAPSERINNEEEFSFGAPPSCASSSEFSFKGSRISSVNTSFSEENNLKFNTHISRKKNTAKPQSPILKTIFEEKPNNSFDSANNSFIVKRFI